MWQRRGREQKDFSAEIAAHIENEVERLRGDGLGEKEARAAARRMFGNVMHAQERFYEAGRWMWWDHLQQDVRFGLRMLRKSPGFSAVVVVTLALGIGANTAIFSFVDAVLLRALPVAAPEQLVVFKWTARAEPKLTGHSGFGDCDRHTGADCSLSAPFYETVRAQARSFSGVAAFAGPLEMDLSGNGPASIANGEYVSGDYFSMLGVKMALGRPLGPESESRTTPAALVLTYGYWKRAFGGDRMVIGRTVRLNNTPVAIVGVTGPEFTGLTPGQTLDFFVPLSLADRVKSEWWGNTDRVADPGSFWVVIVARLKPGVTLAQAEAEATLLFRDEVAHAAKPLLQEADAPAIVLERARQGLNGESNQIAPMVYVMMAAVGLVLLIACANVAGLMAVRAVKRQKEMAVRLALGAGRGRIVGQLLTESVILAMMGGALGTVFAGWGVEVIAAVISGSFGERFPFEVGLDWRVLVFTMGVTLATGVLFGLAPATSAAQAELSSGLKENEIFVGGAGARAARRFRLGDILVMAQVGLSVVALTGAGLLARTLHNLHEVNPGFDTRNLLLFGVNPSIAGYTDEQSARLYGDLQERFAALPGVISASYSEDALVSGSWSGDDVHLDGAAAKSNVNVAMLPVGLDFFATMHIPLLAGRAFTAADFAAAAATRAAKKEADATPPVDTSHGRHRPTAPAVPVIINATFARKLAATGEPLGQHLGEPERDEPVKGPQPGYVIVGVAADTKYATLREELQPMMYLPLVGNSANFELRTTGNPTALGQVVRDVVARTNKNLPLFKMRTQAEQIEQLLFQERVMAQVAGFFAMVAMALACIGLYGLLSYEVARRTKEVGIRIALGAKRDDVLKLVVRRGVLLVLVGTLAGIGIALGVTRFIASLLYHVRASDPKTIAAVAALLLLVALAACWTPARRAMRVDPVVALRHE